MTASEFQSLETHSDATVCSGLYAKSTPKWNTKMHASKLLKGVLISRTLNATSSDQESSSASSPNKSSAPARGKRAFSSNNALSASPSLVPKKTSSSPLVKTTCLCAPTKHAGSFRCRLHRVTQKHWDGRQVHPTSTSASSSASLPANHGATSGTVGVMTPWANGVVVPTSGSMSRTGAAGRPSRLRMVVVAAHADESTDAPDVEDPAPPMLSEGSVKYIKVATSTTITQDKTVTESSGAETVTMSRKLHSSS